MSEGMDSEQNRGPVRELVSFHPLLQSTARARHAAAACARGMAASGEGGLSSTAARQQAFMGSP